MTNERVTVQAPRLERGDVERLWSGVERRRATRMRRRVTAGYVFAAVACFVALALGIRSWRAPESPWSGVSIATGESGQRVELADRSTIDVAARSRIDVCEDAGPDACFVMVAGRASFEVAPQKSRRFLVRVGNVEVHVVGTSFVVERVQSASSWVDSVTVDHGNVEIYLGGQLVRRLSAGEHWRQAFEERKDRSDPAAQVGADPAPPEGSAPPRASAAPSATAARLDEKVDKPNVPSRAALWSLARDAKRRGDRTAELAVYSRILSHYPDDSLAAFELARARMDANDQDPSAANLLEKAAGAGDNAAIREAAAARLVQLYEQRGDRARCEAQRARYLSDFPNGAYRAIVASACGGTSN